MTTYAPTTYDEPCPGCEQPDGTSSSSSTVSPSVRRPSSRSACLIQFRIDCPVGSNSRARSSGLRPAHPRSTICRRNSAEYDVRVFPTCTPLKINYLKEPKCEQNRVNFK
jgi:hypothetical protein